MTKTRDWVTVDEHAKSRGVTRQAIYQQIWRGKFSLPYVRTDGQKRMVLIYDPGAATYPIVHQPQKTKAQKQVNFPQTACNRASDR